MQDTPRKLAMGAQALARHTRQPAFWMAKAMLKLAEARWGERRTGQVLAGPSGAQGLPLAFAIHFRQGFIVINASPWARDGEGIGYVPA